MSHNLQLGPLVITDSVTLAQNEEKALFGKSKLNSPLKTPMLVDEIVFSIGSTSLNGGAQFPAGGTVLNYGGVVLAKLQMDRTELTNGYVPLWNFGRAINCALPGNNTINSDTHGVYVWRLPKPMFMGPNSVLTPMVKRLGEGSIVNVAVRITLFGRALPSGQPFPKTVNIPWVAAWNATSQTNGSDATDQSQGQHLVNPFDVPVKIQRFIGRIKSNKTNLNSPQEAHGTASGNIAIAPPLPADPNVYARWTLVRMHDSRGRILVRDYTPFGLLFNSVDRAWTVDALLNPKEYYKVYLDEKYSNVTTAAVFTPQISMIGYRTLELR